MFSPERRSERAVLRALGRIATWFAASALISALALALVIFGLGFLAPPATLAVVRAESEVVRFRVANAVQATIPVDGFRIDDGDTLDGVCATEALGPGWALEPSLGAEVAYKFETTRGEKLAQRLAIYLSGDAKKPQAAVLRGRDANGVVSTRVVKVDVALLADPACGSLGFLRLPIWGPGEIGGPQSFRADGQAPTLLSGSVEIYGRSTPLDFSFLPSWLGGGARPDESTLFASVAGAFQAPPGSRISTLASASDDGLKAMRGFATVSGDAPRRHFLVNVSTESPELYFFPPGAGGRPDLLKMGLLSRISNDPHIQRVFQILVWFVIMLPIALELARPLFSRTGDIE